ncbi:DUF3300 domain-containing protein [Cupriavidus basilensis]
MITETGTVAGQSGQTIVKIEPASPEVVYVPAYNPSVVYGAWSYPAYPPTYWPPYPAYYPRRRTGHRLRVGCRPGGSRRDFRQLQLGGGDVNINVNKAANIDRNFDRTKTQNGKWQHDASHRKGVAYRDNASREKFGRNVAGADGRNDYRGRGDAGGRQGAADRGSAGDRAGVSDRAGNRGGNAREIAAGNAREIAAGNVQETVRGTAQGTAAGRLTGLALLAIEVARGAAQGATEAR